MVQVKSNVFLVYSVLSFYLHVWNQSVFFFFCPPLSIIVCFLVSAVYSLFLSHHHLSSGYCLDLTLQIWLFFNNTTASCGYTHMQKGASLDGPISTNPMSWLVTVAHNMIKSYILILIIKSQNKQCGSTGTHTTSGADLSFKCG